MAHRAIIQEKQINDAKTTTTKNIDEKNVHREIEMRLCRVAQAYKLF